MFDSLLTAKKSKVFNVNDVDMKNRFVKKFVAEGMYLDAQLTQTEQNILPLLAKGMSMKEVAKFFNRSPRTIECHITALKHKLGCQKTIEAVYKARNMRL